MGRDGLQILDAGLVRLVFWTGGIFDGIQETLAHTDPRIGWKRPPPDLRNRAGSFDRRQGSSQHGISSKQPFSGSADLLSVIAIIMMIAITWRTVKQFIVAEEPFPLQHGRRALSRCRGKPQAY